MRNFILIISTLIGWVMAIAYDRIEKVTGLELTALLWAAIIIIIIGLYTGLIKNGADKQKEES